MEKKPTQELDLTKAAGEIAKQLAIESGQVMAAIELLDAGNTIPFIARYRKEATRGLDEIVLRAIEDAIGKARELFARKNTVLKSIAEQGLLTEEPDLLPDELLPPDDFG